MKRNIQFIILQFIKLLNTNRRKAQLGFSFQLETEHIFPFGNLDEFNKEEKINGKRSKTRSKLFYACCRDRI